MNVVRMVVNTSLLVGAFAISVIIVGGMVHAGLAMTTLDTVVAGNEYPVANETVETPVRLDNEPEALNLDSSGVLRQDGLSTCR